MELSKLKKIVEDLKTEDKPVWIFAILKMDEYIDKWSVAVSAPWADENDDEAFNKIFEMLKLNLSDDERASIARVGILRKDEHLIEELLKKTTDASLENTKINGNFVYEGYVVESNPGLPDSK